MYICLCNPTTDRHIRQAVNQGVKTFRALRERLGVVQECGKCGQCVKQVLRETLETEHSSGCQGACGER